MATQSQPPILVLTATGKVGRRIVERLRARGLPVRPGSRTGLPPFDWEDRATWAPALDGAGAVYLSYSPDLAMDGAAEKVGALARQAVAAGVERLVLLSGRGEPGAQRGEREVQEAGAAWTIVRCSWFAQNFDEGYLLGGVLDGEVALPVTDAVEPFVDADDIAAVAVAALTEPGHGGQVYELTGPRLLTFAEAVTEIAAAAGRPVGFTSVALEDYLAALAREAVPADIAGLLGFLFGEVLDGRNAHLADGVQRALGRPPRDFAEYARAAAATGAWDR